MVGIEIYFILRWWVGSGGAEGVRQAVLSE